MMLFIEGNGDFAISLQKFLHNQEQTRNTIVKMQEMLKYLNKFYTFTSIGPLYCIW